MDRVEAEAFDERKLHAGPGPALLPVEMMSGLVDEFFAGMRHWNPRTDIAWGEIDRAKVSSEDLKAVAFSGCIENHIPAYVAMYNRLYPLDESVSTAERLHHRELYRFVAKWAQEEDGHSQALFRYQVEAGHVDPAALRSELEVVGRPAFGLPQEEPIHLFTYTLIQEKATQLFYQQFAGVTEEPILRQVLLSLAKDEARHFAFFSKVVEAYIRHFGSTVLPQIEETLRSFRMPLADTMERYWRRALEVADITGGYDHTDAYPSLLRVIERGLGDNSNEPGATAIADYVGSVCRH